MPGWECPVTHEHEPGAEAEGGPENDRSLPDAADSPVHATAEESDSPPLPQDKEKGPVVRILVVQMGHCFRTSGATGTPGEQVFVKAVADACVEELDRPGPPGREHWRLRVIKADEPLEQYAGDAFVAFHCDGSANPDARGASVGYRDAAGQSLAQAWKHAYERHGWSGGFRSDNYTENLKKYYGTRKAAEAGNPRAFIAECGFLTNQGDKALLTGPGGADRVTRALFEALGI
ncbi:N-acetylmuramoyl-L-alanine amidase [Streptomyces sp. enrichment culture]|uniref:N-acetylmuramoyl-L-alanine amidase n=1 Tax=Streptomyces sp. enrichment culture TaxID=1795815 RepID=UPI0010C0507A